VSSGHILMNDPFRVMNEFPCYVSYMYIPFRLSTVVKAGTNYVYIYISLCYTPSLRQQRAERKEIARRAILARSQPAGEGLRGVGTCDYGGDYFQ
jgi:hypothetical protein